MRTKRQLVAARNPHERRPVPRPVFGSFGELDLSSVVVADELHDLLERAFLLPGYYGRNWDAFRDCVTDAGQSSLPDLLRVTGYTALAARLPREAKLLRECFDELGERRPGCRVEWCP